MGGHEFERKRELSGIMRGDRQEPLVEYKWIVVDINGYQWSHQGGNVQLVQLPYMLPFFWHTLW